MEKLITGCLTLVVFLVLYALCVFVLGWAAAGLWNGFAVDMFHAPRATTLHGVCVVGFLSIIGGFFKGRSGK